MNPYDELGVPADADLAAINAAYRRKARASHPDHGGDPAAFARLSRAVAILRDPEQRERFDRTGETDTPPPNAERSGAIEVLVQAFMESLGSTPNSAMVNIIAGAKDRIRGHEQLMKVERSRMLAAQRDTAKALDRLGFDGEGPDFLRKALEDQATAIGRALEQIETRQRIITAALEMADDYDWRTDPAPPQPATFFVGGTPFWEGGATTR